jgi:hypothetical protein
MKRAFAFRSAGESASMIFVTSAFRHSRASPRPDIRNQSNIHIIPNTAIWYRRQLYITSIYIPTTSEMTGKTAYFYTIFKMIQPN